jgi:pimeloyl-ACP methyl ester carboxylesterase
MALSTTICGDGHPIVLLPWFAHDGAAMAQAFEPVFSADSPWCRIYLDLPGTGSSSPVHATSNAVLDAVSDTVAAVVGDDRPYLLAGCSYGGYLAAAQARRTPAQLAGLRLVCTGIRIQPGSRNLAGVTPSTPEPDWLDGVPADLHEHFTHAIGRQTRPVAARIARTFTADRTNDEDYLQTLRTTGFSLTEEVAGRPCDAPTTILSGRADRSLAFPTRWTRSPTTRGQVSLHWTEWGITCRSKNRNASRSWSTTGSIRSNRAAGCTDHRGNRVATVRH